jgi:thiamine kinase-like enzyme
MDVLNRDRITQPIDAKMPFLPEALDPEQVQQQFSQSLAIAPNIQVQRIQLIRHKLGRRCLIEYDLRDEQGKTMTLIGKIRAKGTDIRSYEVQQALRQAGFREDSADGIAVPEPLGIIPKWQMWIQRKVSGTVATQLLLEPNGSMLAKRIAEAAHKLHQTYVPTRRRHTISDELKILHERLPLVLQDYPQWHARIERVLAACQQLGQITPEPKRCGIHRDFYPDQVIVDGDRIYLIDLDLYCESNPAIDIGNFIAHIKEQSLRTFGDPNRLINCETALEARFTQLSGQEFQKAIASYVTLTLVRHIYISTQFPERRTFTEALLSLCEQRLASI